MSNVEQLKRLAAAFRKYVKPLEDFKWQGDVADQLFVMTQRAAITKQWETLNAILALCETGHGHLGVAFLRSAYEELIWLEYLHKHPIKAGETIRWLGAESALKSVEEQKNYLGIDAMRNLGWTEGEISRRALSRKTVKVELAEVAKQLGWKLNSNKNQPSFSWILKEVGREKEYRFLYHATSAYVHFSPHELLRRIWGQHGEVKIGSSTFATYWTEFSAYWAANIFVKLMVSCADIWNAVEMQDDEQGEIILKIVQELVPVPIITFEELVAWSEPE